MKIITWNMDCWKREESQRKAAWDYLKSQNVDIALLQESYPSSDELRGSYTVYFHPLHHSWGNTMIIKDGYDCVKSYSFASAYAGSPALMCYDIALKGGNVLTVINAYGKLDYTPFSSEPYATTTMHHILSDITPLVHAKCKAKQAVILAGDFNVSTQIDESKKWPSHKLVFDRIEDLGFVNCTVKEYKGHVQTYPKTKDRQLDYIFVTPSTTVTNCKVHKKEIIFEEKLSDHLPVEIEIKL